MEPGNIVLLNGTSSAGKSTLARAVQAIMDPPYRQIGIDYWLARTPPGYFALSDGVDPVQAAGFLMVIGSGYRLVEMRIGPLGVRWMTGMYKAIAALAAAGTHVVVDDVIYDPRVLRAMVRVLAPYPVLFVGVRCDLAVAERREIARGDRPPGLARAFYPHVHTPGVYDLEIDSAAHTPAECAAQIKHALDTHHPRTALARLAATL